MRERGYHEGESWSTMQLGGGEEEGGEGWSAELGDAFSALSPAEQRALQVTNLFETGHPRVVGFDALAGDFDGQGISFGVLQWNIGTGSLQPLLRTFRDRHPARFASIFEGDAAALGRLLDTQRGESAGQALARQLAWAKTVADRRGVREPWRARFLRLGADPEFRRIQVASIRGRMDRAQRWVRDLGFGTERALALMFDLVTQQGPAWIDRRGSNRRALIASAYAAREQALGRPLTERERLEQIARVIAATSKAKYRDRVLLRKMAIVDGTTRVHGLKAGLDEAFGISDRPLDGSAPQAPPASPAPPPASPARPPSTTAPAPSATGAQLSPLAKAGSRLRKGKARRVPIYGVVVHTTGSGPAEKERKHGKPAIGYALSYYLEGGGGFPHYVIDYDGTIHATCDEREVAWHAGWGAIGGKKAFVGWVAPAWWREAWASWKVSAPPELLAPGTSDPNSATIGIELLGAIGDRGFTDAQHAALARLVRDVRDRNALHIPSAPCPTLLGHEDLLPFTKAEAEARFGTGSTAYRADARGGWDPGAHRSDPRFDWSRLWRAMQEVARELYEAA